MRDLEYDLEVVTEYLNTYLYHDPHQAEYDAKFFRMARDGWIEALRRAIVAEARVKELEAQCATMRRALEFYAYTSPVCTCIVNGKYTEEYRDNGEVAREALSNDAGKALLERVRKLEAVAEVAKGYVQAIDSIWAGKYDLSTVPKGKMLPEETRLRKALAELEGDKDE